MSLSDPESVIVPTAPEFDVPLPMSSGAGPVTLLALMGFRYFGASLFVLGAALVTAAAVALLVAAFSRVT